MLVGPIVLAVVILVILPVIFLVTGMVIAGVYSWLLPEHADGTHEGSELIDLNT